MHLEYFKLKYISNKNRFTGYIRGKFIKKNSRNKPLTLVINNLTAVETRIIKSLTE
jgi:hypothetical protein